MFVLDVIVFSVLLTLPKAVFSFKLDVLDTWYSVVMLNVMCKVTKAVFPTVNKMLD